MAWKFESLYLPSSSFWISGSHAEGQVGQVAAKKK